MSVNSRLYSYFIPVLDVNLVVPNVQIQEGKKERFLLVFFFLMALPNAVVRTFVKKIVSTINFKVISFLQLLKSTAFEGSGGGGGHGGLAMREKLLILPTSPCGEPIYNNCTAIIDYQKFLFNPIF